MCVSFRWSLIKGKCWHKTLAHLYTLRSPDRWNRSRNEWFSVLVSTAICSLGAMGSSSFTLQTREKERDSINVVDYVNVSDDVQWFATESTIQQRVDIVQRLQTNGIYCVEWGECECESLCRSAISVIHKLRWCGKHTQKRISNINAFNTNWRDTKLMAHVGLRNSIRMRLFSARASDVHCEWNEMRQWFNFQMTSPISLWRANQWKNQTNNKTIECWIHSGE